MELLDNFSALLHGESTTPTLALFLHVLQLQQVTRRNPAHYSYARRTLYYVRLSRLEQTHTAHTTLSLSLSLWLAPTYGICMCALVVPFFIAD